MKLPGTYAGLPRQQPVALATFSIKEWMCMGVISEGMSQNI
jgi:hypothetical protein